VRHRAPGHAAQRTGAQRAARPGHHFPWSDYDVEDQGDADGDGNLFEPDGVIDHFVIIHAGADKADDGGVQGPYAIWSHAGNTDPATGGYAIPGTGVKVNNYIMQAEDAGVGVISHEYGHDRGCPTCTTPAAPPSPTSTSGT
jgi:immune inhibitor A